MNFRRPNASLASEGCFGGSGNSQIVMILGSAVFQTFFEDADFLKYAPSRATASTNRTPDQLQMKQAAMPT